ncbi:MAG TPA: hypothetical protein VNX02_10070 [Steroidobacteraceae bacterium]|nr:hypothetical protein [Steroidobacteraceae bacterium]
MELQAVDFRLRQEQLTCLRVVTNTSRGIQGSVKCYGLIAQLDIEGNVQARAYAITAVYQDDARMIERDLKTSK